MGHLLELWMHYNELKAQQTTQPTHPLLPHNKTDVFKVKMCFVWSKSVPAGA